jgi:cytochrome oxidase Cu insertion factor (SCO1/SenC/PrrC family)
MRRNIGKWLGTIVCMVLLFVVATMSHNYHGSPVVKADVTTAVGEVGGRLPDFTLPDIDGEPVSLSQFAHSSRVLLTFERSLDW